MPDTEHKKDRDAGQQTHLCERNMRAENWETLWQGKETQLRWSEPDERIIALMPSLKAERIHRVLDLGCGIGRHVIHMAKSGFETYGLDSSEHGLAHCRKWLAAEGLRANLSLGDIAELPYDSDLFDFVISWNVIYHATRTTMVEVLPEISRVMQSKALLYLTLNSTKNKHYGAGTEVEPGTFDNPEKGDGQHLHHYSDKKDVRDLLSSWDIEEMSESEETLSGKLYPGSWHWMILARKW